MILQEQPNTNTFNFRIPRYVRLGQLNYEEPIDGKQQDFEIKDRIAHPYYQKNLRYHDIALFRLDRDVTPTPYVRPICLHTENSIPSNKVIATGWGKTSVDEGQSPQLLKVTLDIMPITQCGYSYNKDIKKLPKGVLDENMVCAGVNGSGKDTCDVSIF